MIAVQTGAALTGHADFGRFFRDWLAGAGDRPAATADLAAFFDLGAVAATPGAIWSAASWREPWLAELQADLTDPDDRERAAASVAALTAGEADVVITGQQPGFLGGPLYTLYKIATTTVLAEMRSAAGRPTVPVFWCGEDDDDLREALQPVAWDPAREVLVRHDRRGERGLPADRMVGALLARDFAGGEASWLAEVAGRNGLAADLAAIAAGSVDDGQTWGRLQRRALLRVFRGTGLLVVHGNDARLHRAAAPLYHRLWQERDRLREAARQGGRQLTAAGYGTAVSEPSIQRFLHLGDRGRRRPLPAELAGEMPDPATLRPGVLARSPVQDWLFRPAGVVVGPGEAAYLRQLEPVYRAFDLPRAPLLPRLFAQLGPAGYGAFRSWALELADREEPGQEVDLAAVAVATAGSAREQLQEALREAAQVPPERLGEVTDQVLRRWTRHLQNVMAREQRRRHDHPGAGAPAWLRPESRRQERALAALAAVALWGEPFVDALAHAGRRAIDGGLAGDWREYLLTVPAP